MSRFPIAIGASLVVSLLGGCATQTAETSAVQAKPIATRDGPPPATTLKEQGAVTLERIQQVQKTYPLYRTAASTPGFECKLVNDVCHVTVTVFQATDGSTGLKYCIGIAPEFVIIKGKTKFKQIQWELQLVSAQTNQPLPWTDVTPAGSTLGFLGDDEHGILLMKNIYEGGNPNKPQLKDGKRVKWNGVDNTGYLISNLHKENGTATYLPIIVHTDGKPALCGSPDPAIYNVD